MNSGLEEALYLAKICKKVTIVTRGDQFRADEVLMEKARNNEKIVLVPNHEPVEFHGGELLEQVVIKNKITGESKKDIHESDLDYLEKSYNNSLYIADKYDWKKINCVENESLRSIDFIVSITKL